MAPPDRTVLSRVRSLELPGLIVRVLCGGDGLTVLRSRWVGTCLSTGRMRVDTPDENIRALGKWVTGS